MIFYGPDPIERDDPLRAEREECRSLRNAEDMGGTRRIGGRRYDDWPSPDEVD